MGLKDRIKQKAEESKIIPHPLIQKNIDISVKNAYLGGVVLAALLDDADIADPERKRIRELGISLQLGEDGIKEVVSTVENLKSEAEQEAYLEEIVPALKDRDVALFFLCDFAKMVGADGKYTQDDLDYCDALAEWLGLNEKDMAFYKEFRNYLLAGKEMECAVFMSRHADISELPDAFYQFTCPEAIANQAVLQEHCKFFSTAISILGAEIGSHYWEVDEEDLNKRSLEERELAKSFHEAYPEYDKVSFMVGDLANSPKDVNQFVKWLCSEMQRKYPAVNMPCVAQAAMDQLRKEIESAEIVKRIFILAKSVAYGDYAEYHFSLKGSDYESKAEERFLRCFKSEKSHRYFKERCAVLVKSYISQSSEFTFADTKWGFCLFKLIILNAVISSLKTDFIYTDVTISELPELAITEKTKDQLKDILDDWLESESGYANWISYIEDWDGKGALVNFYPALEQIEGDMKRAYDEVEKEYFAEAENNLKVAQDYFRKLISAC